MGAIRITLFSGMIPSVDSRLLPDHAAAYAENLWPHSGKAIGLGQLELLLTGAAATTTAYRIPEDYSNPTYVYNSTWIEFENVDTDVARGMVFNDTHDRYYWCSSGEPAKYNTFARIANGDAPYLLGVPQPSPLAVSPSGGSGAFNTRAYVQTWVTEFGEEGPPSNATTVTGKADDTWVITLSAAAADDIDGPDRDIKYSRIYRTIVSTRGVATYFLVAQVDVGDVTYNDTAADVTVVLNDQLASTTWTGPPDDLEGFVAMPNGFLAGWRENELWFSEPYRPHAWPAEYVLTMEYPIIGLGIVGQTLVVCTAGYPATAYGARPSVMTPTKLSSLEPCVSRGSVISAPEGVYYVSPNGLVRVTPGSAINVTEKLCTKDRWQQLLNLSGLHAARLGSAYYAFGTIQPGVFNPDAFDPEAFTQEDYTSAYVGIMVDPSNERVGVVPLSSEDPVSSVKNDPWSGELIIVKEGRVYRLPQADPSHPTDPFLWRSKQFQNEFTANYGAMQVFFEVPPNTPEQAAERNNTLVQELAADQYGLVRVYADGRHVSTRELRTSGEIWKLPSGFKADFWYFEVEARVRLLTIHTASSVKELRAA